MIHIGKTHGWGQCIVYKVILKFKPVTLTHPLWELAPPQKNPGFTTCDNVKWLTNQLLWIQNLFISFKSCFKVNPHQRKIFCSHLENSTCVLAHLVTLLWLYLHLLNKALWSLTDTTRLARCNISSASWWLYIGRYMCHPLGVGYCYRLLAAAGLGVVRATDGCVLGAVGACWGSEVGRVVSSVMTGCPATSNSTVAFTTYWKFWCCCIHCLFSINEYQQLVYTHTFPFIPKYVLCFHCW